MGIYLDNAATSWPKPEVVYQAVDHFMRLVGATPGRGGHSREEEAAHIADQTRTAIANLFHAPERAGVVFTLNATQAINMALKGLLQAGDHVITTSIEHNAMWRPLKAMERHGVAITAIPCAADGTLKTSEITSAIQPGTRLIAMLHASNVLGTILPMAEIGAIAHEHGIHLLVDAAQTAGVIPIDMRSMKIDMLAFSGHKGLFGPHGTGGLVVAPQILLEPLMEGGSGVESIPESMPKVLPQRLEAGTQNAAGIAGLLAGVNFVLEQGVEAIRTHELALTASLIGALGEAPSIRLLGPSELSQRTAVVSVTVKDYVPDQLATVLDQVFDIATRAGLHCAPQAHRTAGTLENGALRFSPGYFTTEDEIHTAAEALLSIL